jgi:hypothetical protein
MTGSDASSSGFSLIFAPGKRPSVNDIADLLTRDADAARAFAITHRPAASEGWVELLANGLTFDVSGLSPTMPAVMPDIRHRYGFPPNAPTDIAGQSIEISPGDHLSGGKNLVPVVRGMAGVVVALLGLPGVLAVVWGPSQTIMPIDYFRRAIGAWLAGGAFPALGLTALTRDPSGAIVSEGLRFFTGQELRIEPIVAKDPAAAGKVAIRLIHSLIGGWAVQSPVEFAGPDGERLCVEPTGNGRFLRVWRTH